MKDETVEGLVVKVTDQHVVLLCKNGTFRNVPCPSNKVPKLGQRFSFTEKKRSHFTGVRAASIAAVFLLAALLFAMFATNQASAAYCVAIDINPKVEVYADEHFHVLKVEALNDDGQQIKESLQIQGHSLFDVVQQVVENSIAQGFLPKHQKGLITTTIIPLQKNLKFIDTTIEKSIKKPLHQNAIAAEVAIMDGNKQLLKSAEDAGLSANQFQFYRKLESQGVPITTKEIRNKTMKQLKEMIVHGKPVKQKVKPEEEQTMTNSEKEESATNQALETRRKGQNNSQEETNLSSNKENGDMNKERLDEGNKDKSSGKTTVLSVESKSEGKKGQDHEKAGKQKEESQRKQNGSSNSDTNSERHGQSKTNEQERQPQHDQNRSSDKGGDKKRDDHQSDQGKEHESEKSSDQSDNKEKDNHRSGQSTNIKQQINQQHSSDDSEKNGQEHKNTVKGNEEN